MNKIIVAISGASGSVYAKILLDKLILIKSQWTDLGIIITDNAKLVWETEIGENSYNNYDAKYYRKNDFMAPFASGSANYNIMIIAPCSMGTVARIASGISDDLISRAADVVLKERRKLICVVRETPYNLIHLNNMETITRAGGIICPASPSFYSKPKTIEEAVSTVIDRVIHLAGLEIESFKWQE
ncbi:MAG TPA: UbiX family flavin prenyltransferase [Hanamia sp.]|jgi:flavin prenyltransferase|nr:UbiX family flavin prenyltransferase [Hanamia sp.]